MHGHAYNSISGQTINDSQLSFFGNIDVMSDSYGYFLTLISPGTYDISVVAGGYHEATFENIMLSDGSVTTKHFGLLPELRLDHAIKVLQIISGIEPPPSVPSDFDFNGDGKIGLPECIYILQSVAGLRQ